MDSLKDTESIGDGLERLLRAQLQKAAHAARAGGEDAVHGVRKACKQARGLLRVVREHLGDDAFAAINAAIRDLARPLGPVRDTQALVAALATLAAHRELAADTVSRMERALRGQLTDAERALARSGALDQAAAALDRVLDQLDELAIGDAHGRDVARSLERLLGQYRRAEKRAHKRPSDARLHEWRKQSKYLRAAIAPFTRAWPKLESIEKKLHDLSDLLGDDHDLAVLAQEIVGLGFAVRAADREALLDAILARREELQCAAFELAGPLRLKPHATSKRLRARWQNWRAG